MKNINWVKGKTIKSINTKAVNELILHFTDGTWVAVEAITAIPTQYGNIPGFETSGFYRGKDAVKSERKLRHHMGDER